MNFKKEPTEADSNRARQIREVTGGLFDSGDFDIALADAALIMGLTRAKSGTLNSVHGGKVPGHESTTPRGQPTTPQHATRTNAGLPGFDKGEKVRREDYAFK